MNAPIFPNETLTHILDFAIDYMEEERDTSDSSGFEQGLLKLSSISQLFRTVALPVIFRHIDLYSFEQGLGFLDLIAHPSCPIAGGIFTLQISIYLNEFPNIADEVAAFTLAWHTVVPRLVRLTTLVVAFSINDTGFPDRFFNVYQAHQLPNLLKLAFFAHPSGDVDFSSSTSGDESSEDEGEDNREQAFVDEKEDEDEEQCPFWDLDNCGGWASVLCDNRLNRLHYIVLSLPPPAFGPPTYRRLNQVITSWFPSLAPESSLRKFILHSGYRDETDEITRYRDDHPDPVFEDILNYEQRQEYLKTHPDTVPDDLIEGPDSSMHGPGNPGDLDLPGVIWDRSVVEGVSVWCLGSRWSDAYCEFGEHLFFDEIRLGSMRAWRLSGEASEWFRAERE
ncbi:hypothetical protein R3P38DRAFT_2779805 [Favolaschia claudopus]|uniref:Uncharacterized protein n=1 Tax=Favolaschia claudopus TaxID=2862362 RepID=A0AAW0BA99_9AGAR